MIRALARSLATGLALVSLAGCCWFWRPSGADTLVVVVPSRHDGHVGAVVVNQGDQHELLNSAYASADAQANGHIHRDDLKPDDIERIFGAASAALPRRAVSFTLYFERAQDVLTAESAAKLEQALNMAAGWEASEITVVGHTDLVGSDELNDELSLKRAEHVRRMLIDKGAAAPAVTAVGMGKREPIVHTANGVAEAANRRVEVQIR
jgi:outer membrane protein OmpA-like peptidoglycan-associated protein